MSSTPYMYCPILTYSPLYRAVRGETSVGGPYNLRSSGKRPLTTKEADRREVLARKKRSSRVRLSSSKPIVISDDEEEDQAAPECPSGFPDPAAVRSDKGKLPVGHDEPRPLVQPLAMIAPGQECVDPDPNTVGGVLQRLDNALKQIIPILGAKWGFHADLRPFLASFLGDIRRVGGVQLALRCECKLLRWDHLALRAEKLASFEPRNEIRRLIKEAQAKIMQEREARAQQVLEHEAIAADLRERQHRLQRAMDDHASVMGVRRELSSLSTDVHRAFTKAMHTLYLLQREEDASIAALSEERLEKEAKAQVQAKWEKEVADLKIELDSFTVLDCA